MARGLRILSESNENNQTPIGSQRGGHTKPLKNLPGIKTDQWFNKILTISQPVVFPQGATPTKRDF